MALELLGTILHEDCYLEQCSGTHLLIVGFMLSAQEQSGLVS